MKTRREFLGLASVGALLALAGCSTARAETRIVVAGSGSAAVPQSESVQDVAEDTPIVAEVETTPAVFADDNGLEEISYAIANSMFIGDDGEMHTGHRITSGEARITGGIPHYKISRNGSVKFLGWYYLVYDENELRLLVDVFAMVSDELPISARIAVTPLTWHKDSAIYGNVDLKGMDEAMQESTTGALSYISTYKGCYLYDGEQAFLIADPVSDTNCGTFSDCESSLSDDEKKALPVAASVMYVPGIEGVELVDASETQPLPYESPEDAGYYSPGE